MNAFTHFHPDEFDCKCCGQNWIKDRLIHQLDKLRAAYGAPVQITSGYRCPARNKAVGGHPNSQHVLGSAADITGHDLDKLYALAQVYFMAVGDGRPKGFIHVDLRNDKVRRWNY